MEMSKNRSKLIAAALATVCIAGSLTMVGCSSSGEETTGSADTPINVITREDGSGTRGAFTELLDIESEDGGDLITSSAVTSNSTAVVLTNVAGDPNSIGYISLGSLNDTVKAVTVDGVEATAENVTNGSYTLARPFNIVPSASASSNEAATDFQTFIMSAEGQAIIAEEGYVAIDSDAPSYTASGVTGTVVCAGSSSVSPVMEALADAYEALNPDVTIEVQTSDSSTGIQMAIEGTCDFGMASREISDSEAEQGATAIVIAQDGIAVIVNPENSVSALTSEQIAQIFIGEITDWSEIGTA